MSNPLFHSSVFPEVIGGTSRLWTGWKGEGSKGQGLPKKPGTPREQRRDPMTPETQEVSLVDTGRSLRQDWAGLGWTGLFPPQTRCIFMSPPLPALPCQHILCHPGVGRRLEVGSYCHGLRSPASDICSLPQLPPHPQVPLSWLTPQELHETVVLVTRELQNRPSASSITHPVYTLGSFVPRRC